MGRCRCGGSGWVRDLTWCGNAACCPEQLNCLRCNPDAHPEPCGLGGDSDVGYCRCTHAAGHPPGEHGCQHGAWW